MYNTQRFQLPSFNPLRPRSIFLKNKSCRMHHEPSGAHNPFLIFFWYTDFTMGSYGLGLYLISYPHQQGQRKQTKND